MNIQKLIKENYEIAKSKGFYGDDTTLEDHLMGIVSEIGEAYEAHRLGKIFGNNEKQLKQIYSDLHLKESTRGLSGKEQYEISLSGTFEDELADVFIRLFNLCGWLGINDVELLTEHLKTFKNWVSTLYIVNQSVSDIAMPYSDELPHNDVVVIYIRNIISFLLDHCKQNSIDIEKHIQAKMEYNKTREYLHGKQY